VFCQPASSVADKRLDIAKCFFCSLGVHPVLQAHGSQSAAENVRKFGKGHCPEKQSREQGFWKSSDADEYRSQMCSQQ